MKAYSLVAIVVALAHWSAAYSSYQRPVSGGYSSGYSSSYASSSSSGSSSSTSSASSSSSLGSSASSTSSSASTASAYDGCCTLNSWALNHMMEVREYARRFKQAFNVLSRGEFIGPRPNLAELEGVAALVGTTPVEMDALAKSVVSQLVADMRSGVIAYNKIAQPNFFEWKASQTLESCIHNNEDLNQQPESLDYTAEQRSETSKYSNVQTLNSPSELDVINGKVHVVHNNVPSSSLRPTTYSSYPGIYISPGASSTVTHKRTMYDWSSNQEPTVLDYQPVIKVDSDWTSQYNSYKPPVHIPVETGPSSDVETIGMGSNHYYPQTYNPGSTVTIKRYNKTIITHPDGTNMISGSESNKKWVDGKLVYDSERPFGESTTSRDDAWKREERERLFWFLTDKGAQRQRLEAWQRQQEERLLSVATRYHTTVEKIEEWHQQEVDRFYILSPKYQSQYNPGLKSWQRMECARLDWLIDQNKLTRNELERWQHENNEKLQQLARKYQVSLEEFNSWQVQELTRLSDFINNQNNSMITRPIPSESLYNNEQERLEELIRQHNVTIAQLHNSIKMDQKKLTDLTQSYHGNVQDLEKWLKNELDRLSGIIKEQGNQMTLLTEWQTSERQRLENIVKQHQGSVGSLESQMTSDHLYIKSLADKYHVSIAELEKWQSTELDRLRQEGQMSLNKNLKEWQQREHEHLMSLIKKNDLTIEEFHAKIMNDRARLENLASTYKIQVSEVEDWIKNEIKNFQSQGLLKEVEKELALWQQKERERLLAIVQKNELTVEELEKKIKTDQTHLYTIANTHQVRVEEIEEWLKKELLRLQGEGLIKISDLKDWQQTERDQILKIVQENKLTIDEFEKKLLADRARLQDLSRTYNVQTSEIESWIKKEGERLQSLGLLQMQEHLNNWQKIERDRLMNLIKENNLSFGELEENIKKDRTHLYSLAYNHQVRVEEIEEWIKNEIKRLQQEGVLQMEKLKDWQTEFRGNLTNMVKDRDFTVEEFHKWLLEDRSRLQTLAMQHNVQIEEIEQWVRNEEQRFVSMGLLKPNEKLTNWQEVERRYLERVTQEQYHSTEQLEQRLRQDRELLEQLARQYSVQVAEVEQWMKKELSRLRDQGQLQIDNLTSWQIKERDRLNELIKQNKNWSAEELDLVLKKDRDHMQKLAFQYHTSVEEIEKWVQSEVERLRQQGKLNIQELTAWQKAEQQRIFNLLQQQSSITIEEFETKIQQDRRHLTDLANQYHISVLEVEEYVKNVIEDLRKKGKFEVENLQTWQVVERDYIKQLISHHSDLTTMEFEKKLLNDRAHLQQLADQYRINVEQIEKWMIEELKRLQAGSANHLQQLSTWQVAEAQRLKDMVRQNNQLNFVEFEVELMKERARLQALSTQYAVSVEEIERWLRQQLINLKTTGQIQVENLTIWQEAEQKRLIDMLLQQQKELTFEEFNQQLRQDRARLQKLASQYSISVEQIESWMKDELQRLKNSGLVQVEQLTYWQKIERDRLKDWLNQQNNAATFDEFKEFLNRDQDRINRIASDYQITVNEIESWVQQEGARLQILGLIQRPEKIVDQTVHHWTIHNSNNPDLSADNMWKVHTLAHLKAIAQVKPMYWQDFERYLSEERMRWQQFARQYNITVEEIEFWLRQAAQGLKEQGLIHGTLTIEEWEVNEREHIQNLINDKLRQQQQQWSIEELLRQLKNDHNHLQKLALQYHITIENIEEWYTKELQRLLDERRLISENLTDWQRREKDRIYWIVMRQPSLSLYSLEQQLLQDKQTLQNLAKQYSILVEELEYWIRNELKRLVNLGLVQNVQNVNTNSWQKEERARLRTIVQELTITEEEFLEFISTDYGFQQQLAKLYGIGLDQLAPFQRIEINAMHREDLLDNTNLLTLQPWQRRERDRLYTMIKNQNFSLKNLRDLQRQDMYLIDVASKYTITVQVLKDWQIKEFERLMQVAQRYQMSLGHLQSFRDQELYYMSFVMHNKTSSVADRQYFDRSEAARIESLERRTGLYGGALYAWRRKLYLLSQGLLALDFEPSGVHQIGPVSTNRTGIPHQVISKDRGDQPPVVYDEPFDADEPGIEGEDVGQITVAPVRLTEPSSTPRPVHYTPITVPGSTVQSGYRYTKKEYQFTVPVTNAVASARSDSHSSSANAAIGIGAHPPSSYGYLNDQTHRTRSSGKQEREIEDSGHQQQQEEEVEDFGQQQQVNLEWNGKLSTNDNGQQQQVQVDDWIGDAGNSGSYSGAYSSHRQDSNSQPQVQVEDLSSTFPRGSAGPSEKRMVPSPELDVKTEAEKKPDSLWGKFKEKTSSIFG